MSNPMQMKPAAEPLEGYEYALQQPEFLGSRLKYDNRAFLAGSFEFFLATPQNPLEKPTAPGAELPVNPSPELLPEGYRAVLNV